MFTRLMNIYEDDELTKDSTVRKFRIVRMEGNREVSREIDHYKYEQFAVTRRQFKERIGESSDFYTLENILKDQNRD